MFASSSFLLPMFLRSTSVYATQLAMKNVGVVHQVAAASGNSAVALDPAAEPLSTRSDGTRRIKAGSMSGVRGPTGETLPSEALHGSGTPAAKGSFWDSNWLGSLKRGASSQDAADKLMAPDVSALPDKLTMGAFAGAFSAFSRSSVTHLSPTFSSLGAEPACPSCPPTATLHYREGKMSCQVVGQQMEYEILVADVPCIRFTEPLTQYLCSNNLHISPRVTQPIHLAMHAFVGMCFKVCCLQRAFL